MGLAGELHLNLEGKSSIIESAETPGSGISHPNSLARFQNGTHSQASPDINSQASPDMSPFPKGTSFIGGAQNSFIDAASSFVGNMYTEPEKNAELDEFEFHDTGDAMGELRIQMVNQETQTENAQSISTHQQTEQVEKKVKITQTARFETNEEQSQTESVITKNRANQVVPSMKEMSTEPDIDIENGISPKKEEDKKIEEQKKQRPRHAEPPQTARASNSRKIQLNLLQEEEDTDAGTFEMDFMTSQG